MNADRSKFVHISKQEGLLLIASDSSSSPFWRTNSNNSKSQEPKKVIGASYSHADILKLDSLYKHLHVISSAVGLTSRTDRSRVAHDLERRLQRLFPAVQALLQDLDRPLLHAIHTPAFCERRTVNGTPTKTMRRQVQELLPSTTKRTNSGCRV